MEVTKYRRLFQKTAAGAALEETANAMLGTVAAVVAVVETFNLTAIDPITRILVEEMTVTNHAVA